MPSTRIALMGFGRIGREVAARARAFGMSVLVHDPFVDDTLAREWEARCTDLDRLLAEAVRVLHGRLEADERSLDGVPPGEHDPAQLTRPMSRPMSV